MTLSDFKDKHIAIVGDLMLDEYIWGKVDRISPEAPVPVLLAQNETHTLGGAGNVINNVHELGGIVYAFGIIGKDKSGNKLCNLLEDLQINVEDIIEENWRSTTTKTRIMAGNQQLVRIDRENDHPMSDDSMKKMLEKFARITSDINAVIISDYNKGMMSNSFTQQIIGLAKMKKLPIIVDPKGSYFGKYYGATVITPNRKETEAFAGMPMSSGKTTLGSAKIGNSMTIADEIFETTNVEHIVITDGDKGMKIFSQNQESLGPYIIEPYKPKQIFDVSGAGDTVVAVLALALACDMNITKAAEIANIAAGLVVGKVGTASVSVAEILKA